MSASRPTNSTNQHSLREQNDAGSVWFGLLLSTATQQQHGPLSCKIGRKIPRSIWKIPLQVRTRRVVPALVRKYRWRGWKIASLRSIVISMSAAITSWATEAKWTVGGSYLFIFLERILQRMKDKIYGATDEIVLVSIKKCDAKTKNKTIESQATEFIGRNIS